MPKSDFSGLSLKNDLSIPAFYPLDFKGDTFDVEALLQQVAVPLRAWFCLHARSMPWRQSPSPYHTWVSEIMLQQTRVEAVIPYYLRFLEALPTLPALAAASEAELHKLWEGLGYYSRVRNMKQAALQVMEHHHGQLPHSYEKLLQLQGIGDYTAGAIASIAFEQAVPAVDGNVLRVLSRLLASYSDVTLPTVKKTLRTLACHMLPSTEVGNFNQAVMELGATVCLPNGAPHCLHCPLSSLCRGNQLGCALDLPLKTPKKDRTIEQRTILVVVYRGMVWLRQRPQTGLLAKLWEFPNALSFSSPAQISAQLKQLGGKVAQVQSLGASKHSFTHKEWKMQGFLVEMQEPFALPEGCWVDLANLPTYTFPSAFKAYTTQLPQILE